MDRVPQDIDRVIWTHGISRTGPFSDWMDNLGIGQAVEGIFRLASAIAVHVERISLPNET